jgi:rhodanese-related sulfurtransferase
MVDAFSATEAWAFLEANPGAELVDVRTRAEWMFVGVPNLDSLGRKPVLVEWTQFGGSANAGFLDELKAAVPVDHAILMLCRSGARSLAAANAAKAAGYATVINISDGFEGDLNLNKHRNQTNGWRHSGLPWHQS